MGLFNKGENAAEGIRRSLRKRGIKADFTVARGMAYASAEDVGAPGTEFSVTWMNKRLTVEFKLGTKSALYELSRDLVARYNATSPAVSHADLCALSNARNPGYHKAFIEGEIASTVADKADEVELFLDMILEDIFDTHADIIKLFYLNLKLAALS